MKARSERCASAALVVAGIVALVVVCAPGGPEMTVVRLQFPVLPPPAVAAAGPAAVPVVAPASVTPPMSVPPSVTVAPASTVAAPPKSVAPATSSLPPSVVIPVSSGPDVSPTTVATGTSMTPVSWPVDTRQPADAEVAEVPDCHPYEGGSVPVAAAPGYADRLFELQNELRARYGLAPLVWDAVAVAAADAAAVRLAGSGELAHFTSAAPCRVLSLEQYAEADGTWEKLAENVGSAAGAPEAVDALFGAYVASPGHLDNILDPAFDRVGIATFVSAEDGTTMQWNAVVFAGATSPVDAVVPTTDASTTPGTSPEPTG